MSYLEEIIQPGETVQHVGTLHWIIFLPGLLLLVLAALLFVFVPHTVPAQIRLAVSAFCLAAAVVSLLGAWVRRLTTEIVVTNRRIVLKSGLVSRRTLEMNMAKVESVDVTQGILGRILNFGTVVIRGVGAGIEPLRDVERPIALRNAVTAL